MRRAPVMGHDRRPWLIISRREAIALQEALLFKAARGRDQLASPDLQRALRVIDRQLKYIDDDLEDEGRPSVEDALRRDEFHHG